MAIGSIIHKVSLQISNMDNHYYHLHKLTLAKHASETDERLMIRILAFALYANERLVFGEGISNQDEPALWIKDMTGEIELWIEVGVIDESRIRKACGRSKQVVVVLFGSKAERWWIQNRKNLSDKKNLTIINLLFDDFQSMTEIATRNMQLTCNIEDGLIQLFSEETALSIEKKILHQVV